MSLTIILLFCALGLTLIEATDRCKPWVAKVFIIVALLIQFWGK